MPNMGSYYGICPRCSFTLCFRPSYSRQPPRVLQTPKTPLIACTLRSHSKLPTTTTTPLSPTTPTNIAGVILGITTKSPILCTSPPLTLDRPHRYTVSFALEKKVIFSQSGLVWLDCIHEWIWISHSGYPIALVWLLCPCKRKRKTKVCLPFDDCNRNKIQILGNFLR